MPEEALGTLAVYIRARYEDFVRGLRGAERELRSWGERTRNFVQRHQQQIRQIGYAFTAMGAGIIAAAGGAVKAYADFEKAMIGVRKTADLTDEEMRELAQGFRELSAELPTTATEMAEVGEIAGVLGIEGVKNILAFSDTVVKTATITRMTAEQAALYLGKFSAAFDLPIERSKNLISMVDRLEAEMAAFSDEILEATIRIAPSARALGITSDAAAAMAAVLIDAGMAAERAGTTINSALVKMTGNFEKMAEVMGISVEELRQRIEVDAMATIKEFLDLLGATPGKVDKITAAHEVFGMVGARAMAILALNYEEKLVPAMKLAADEFARGEHLNREYARAIEGLVSQFKILWGKIDALLVQLGEKLAPLISKFIEDAGRAVDAVAQWAEAHPELVKWLTLVGGALGALAAALGPILIFLPQIINSLGLFSSALGVVGKWLPTILGGLKLLLGPLGLLLTAVGLLATAWMKDWGGIRTFTLWAIEQIGGQLKIFIDWVARTFGPTILRIYSDYVQPALSYARLALEGFIEFLKGAIGVAIDYVLTGVDRARWAMAMIRGDFQRATELWGRFGREVEQVETLIERLRGRALQHQIATLEKMQEVVESARASWMIEKRLAELRALSVQFLKEAPQPAQKLAAELNKAAAESGDLLEQLRAIAETPLEMPAEKVTDYLQRLQEFEATLREEAEKTGEARIRAIEEEIEAIIQRGEISEEEFNRAKALLEEKQQLEERRRELERSIMLELEQARMTVFERRLSDLRVEYEEKKRILGESEALEEWYRMRESEILEERARQREETAELERGLIEKSWQERRQAIEEEKRLLEERWGDQVRDLEEYQRILERKNELDRERLRVQEEIALWMEEFRMTEREREEAELLRLEEELIRRYGLEEEFVHRYIELKRTQLQAEADWSAQIREITEQTTLSLTQKWGMTGKIIGDVMQRGVQTISTSLSQGMADWLKGTITFSQMMERVWKSFVDTLIAEIGRLIAEMLVLKTLKMALGLPFESGGIITERGEVRPLPELQEGGVIPAILHPGEVVMPLEKIGEVFGGLAEEAFRRGYFVPTPAAQAVQQTHTWTINVNVQGGLMEDPAIVDRVWRDYLQPAMERETERIAG